MRAERRLAKFLGWFSLGLGVPQVVMPRRVARLIGVRDDRGARRWMRVVGLREHAAAAGILSRRRPVGWLSARVAGDVMDLALLGAALTRKDRSRRRWGLASPQESQDRRRIGMAIGAVGGVLVADALAAVSLSRRSADEPEEQPLHVKAAITVARDPDLVQRAWVDMHGGDGMGIVRFVTAPGGRGTEIHVDTDSGDAGPVKKELRSFKQVLETGEEVRS